MKAAYVVATLDDGIMGVATSPENAVRMIEIHTPYGARWNVFASPQNLLRAIRDHGDTHVECSDGSIITCEVWTPDSTDGYDI